MRASILLAILSLTPTLWAQANNNLEVIRQIKVEAFQNSKVMDHLADMSDRYGPRLTASPEFDQAAEWAMGELKSYGLANVHEEKWGPFGRSWSVESYTLDMLSPRYSHLVAAPLAWSSPTHGMQSGEVLYAPFEGARYYEVAKAREALEKYKAQWHGKLKGKILLFTNSKEPKPSIKPLFERYTDAQLADLAKAPAPALRRHITVDQVVAPEDPEDAEKYFASLPSSVMDDLFDRYNDFKADVGAFLSEEGVVGVITADRRSHNGIVNAENAGAFNTKKAMAPPTFVVTEEQYSRMQRLVDKKQPVSVRLDLQVKFSDRDVDGANIIAEIPGRKKPDEVVMIGAHFDSWHSATGATDNGAGSAVMMEVMRILKTLNLPMDRTVRIGLWSGEEQGDFGSRAYIKQHYADVGSGELKPEQQKFDIYFNLDNGAGKIRGIYLEENDAIRPLFETFLAPFRDLDVSTISGQHTTDTDHVSFDEAGLPGFQFIQDPLDYDALTHHSDVDAYSHAIPEDLMQASAVIASLVFDFANLDELAPRKQVIKDGKLVNY